MENWDDLKFFLAVQKTGTMVAAARQLGTNAATVSRRLERLSTDLGAQPFIKSAGDWQLNPALHDLLQIVEDFDAKLSAEKNALALRNGAHSAVTLRIGAPPFVLGPLLAPHVGSFHTSHPGYRIEFHDRITSEGLGNVDVLVMPGSPVRGRIITRRIGQCAFRLYTYPDAPQDDAWVGLVPAHRDLEPFQRVEAHFRRPPAIQASSFIDAHALARSSRLPVLLPTIMGEADADLIPHAAFPDPMMVDFWIAFHGSRKTDEVVSATVKWIISCFSKVHQQAA